jgi:hypothetical protein
MLTVTMDKNELSEKLAELGHQIARASATWEAALQPIVKSSVALQKSLQDMMKPVANINKVIEAALLPLGKQIETFQNAFAPIIAALALAVEQMPEKNRQALMILAENGWYLDPDFSFGTHLEMANKFFSGSTVEANNAFCDYFDSRITEIDLDLNKQLPARGRLLSLAFHAHRAGNYALSIPVFLAQADGICKEITGEQLYSRRNGMPKLASILLTPDMSPLSKSFLAPIVEPMPISASAIEREQMDNILNRNAILHGESTDYDNRLNSCRAISLLVYVAWILKVKE